MSRLAWIVCEQSGRWAAALRTTLRRSGWPSSQVPRVFEVRQLSELAERLVTRPNDLVLVEVRRENLSDILGWLAAAILAHRHARFAALVDRGVWEIPESNAKSPQMSRQLVEDCLREAGAGEVVTSPRQVPRILTLARQHASLREEEMSATLSQHSIEEAVWASLPWQADN